MDLCSAARGGRMLPSRSESRIPGRNRKKMVAGTPRTPAPMSVGPTPTASAIGPVRANETGISETETSQSRLETRPSRQVGTRRCMRVAQTTSPAVKLAPPTKLAAMACQRSVASPYGAAAAIEIVPRDVHEAHVPPREASLADDERGEDRADAAGCEDEAEVVGAAAELVLDDVRDEHLVRPDEEEEPKGRGGEGPPEPHVRAHELEAFCELAPHGGRLRSLTVRRVRMSASASADTTNEPAFSRIASPVPW